MRGCQVSGGVGGTWRWSHDVCYALEHPPGQELTQCILTFVQTECQTVGLWGSFHLLEANTHTHTHTQALSYKSVQLLLCVWVWVWMCVCVCVSVYCQLARTINLSLHTNECALVDGCNKRVVFIKRLGADWAGNVAWISDWAHDYASVIFCVFSLFSQIRIQTESQSTQYNHYFLCVCSISVCSPWL